MEPKYGLLIWCLSLAMGLWGASTAPPQPLHKVGDHWTPYTPPTEFPEGAEVYIIQPGDTLWDLAEKWLGDPHLWPQIWEKNGYIQDAHWIYPGDPLVKSITVAEKPVEEKPEEPTPPQEAAAPSPTEKPEVLATPYPIGVEKDVYCSFRIADPKEDYPITIQAAQDEKLRFTLSQGDVVFLSSEAKGKVQAGETYFIAEDRGMLKNAQGKTLGHLWYLHGQLEILCANEQQITAMITKACDTILRGYHLIPFEVVPIPTALPKKFETVCLNPYIDPIGSIVEGEDRKYSLSQGDNVVIDLGSSDGLEPGQYFRVFRKLTTGDTVVLGRIGILQVFAQSATAKILESVRTIEEGDLVAPER